ncbi:hypothetical protein NDU88_001998 [Pleurodeles waltl]|uniref:Uncharacterized protein n=1 Tax=Pleurodeles waltl TaxID=8319 RepID=A0AAV7NE46_PLEWA|nr:hypothetical protein NDU88_001998 [Pleurodeles waltl]
MFSLAQLRFQFYLWRPHAAVPAASDLCLMPLVVDERGTSGGGSSSGFIIGEPQLVLCREGLHIDTMPLLAPGCHVQDAASDQCSSVLILLQ